MSQAANRHGPRLRSALTALCIGAALGSTGANAGVFDDDEARRAILELRQYNDQQRARQAEQAAALTDQINQLKRSLLDLNNQIEGLRADNAKLRGQGEQLARDLAELQRKQKDTQSGVDERMRRFEPQKVTLDGKEFTAEPDEKRQYDEAMELFRKSDFPATVSALTAFRKRYPSSGYNDSVLFWLGNAQYGGRQYKEAIASFRSLIGASPDMVR